MEVKKQNAQFKKGIGIEGEGKRYYSLFFQNNEPCRIT